MKAIPEIIVKQKEYFKSGKTKSVAFRISILKALKKELEANEQAVFNALKLDFKKSEFETYLSEYSMVMSQLNLVIKNLKNGQNHNAYLAACSYFRQAVLFTKNLMVAF
ncbi:aldehyde dehydrogenase [Algibacter lectus]|uniref:Aldehyde dehydrogenase n=1 Tax=Algibacter lectus TaxID=221126 RepID=A0A090WKR4_9FLAO|nr:hypothetical protein [Algibacter lectus]GAL77586.1 aldehyde dehydrogenase [Algibacter lectus]